MDTNLYRLVYCSKNRIHGSETETLTQLREILDSARKNNERHAITGALLFSGGNFAQVLEGSVAAIGDTFEKIQRDQRHAEITVLENGRVAERIFPAWSMALAETTTIDDAANAGKAFAAVISDADQAGGQMIALLRQLIAQEDAAIARDVA